MTVQAVTKTELVPSGDQSSFLFTWTAMANGDSGVPVNMVPWADRCVAIAGTWGAGGAAVFEGSNDGANYFTLNNVQGTALSFSANGLKQVVEVPVWVRPRVTGGDGTTALVATLCVRRPNPMRT